MDNMLGVIEQNKESMTDGLYKDLMDALKDIHDNKVDDEEVHRCKEIHVQWVVLKHTITDRVEIRPSIKRADVLVTEEVAQWALEQKGGFKVIDPEIESNTLTNRGRLWMSLNDLSGDLFEFAGDEEHNLIKVVEDRTSIEVISVREV